MRSVSRDGTVWLLGGALAVGALGFLTLRHGSWGDFNSEAWPAVHALVSGHLARSVELAPPYGGSLILRTPLFLITRAVGGGEAAMYVVSSLAVLGMAGALALWLIRAMGRRGVGPTARAVVLVLFILNPMTISAVQHGHPEEILGTVLCLTAVLAALRGRPTLAGVALGLAIGNKAWGVLAVGPVLLALPSGRLRALGWAIGVSAVLTIPFLVAGASGSDHGARTTITSTGAFFTRWQLWWFLGHPGHLLPRVDPRLVVAYRSAPGWLKSLAHPLIAALVLPLTLLYLPARHRQGSELDAGLAPVLLLALLLLLRCALDPADFSYYSVPFLLTLLTWEALRFNRPPILALGASLAAWFAFLETPQPALGLSTDAQALIFLAFALLGIGLIAVRLYLAPRFQALGARSDRPRPGVSRTSVGVPEVSWTE